MTDPAPPRILLVTRNLPPLVGGMERLNWHLADELSRYAQVRVIAPQGAAGHAPTRVEVREVPLRPLWRFLASTHWHAWREARRWRPNVVVAGSGLTALPVLLAARRSGARAAVYVHGLDVVAPHWLYRSLWLPALRRMDRVVANSRATAKLAADAGVEPSRLGIVHPGAELLAALPDDRAIRSFRTRHALGDRPLLLSVGRLSTRKGLREFVEHALPKIAAAVPDVTLLVIGDAPGEALHAQSQTPESILAAARQAGVESNIRFLGVMIGYGLGVAYGAADVHVFPVREIPGDPEGFGMVAIEAAVHGLPTVAFATGGVVDAVEEGESGHLVTAGDYDGFSAAVLKILLARDRETARCREFATRFVWSRFGEQLANELLGKSGA